MTEVTLEVCTLSFNTLALKYNLCTNWSRRQAACFPEAAPHLLRHNLSTALVAAAAVGYGFAHLAQPGDKTNGDESPRLYQSRFILLPTKAIFKTPLRSWWAEATQRSTLMVHEMCNFYLRCATSCVLAASRGVSAQPSFHSRAARTF